MSAPKWERVDDFVVYPVGYGLAYYIDLWPDGTFQAQACFAGEDQQLGPARKSRQAAHNDCKRHAKKLRAALVQFDRAKL